MANQKKAQEELVRIFLRNGCFRRPDKKRLKEGHRKYKKGYETRFTVFKKEEILIKQLLSKSGFTYGKSFKKVKRIVIPVYGYDNMMAFQKMISENKKKEK